MTNIEEKTIALVADFLGVEKSKVTKETRFKKDLDADSLDMVEMTMIFEKEFTIAISDEDLKGIVTIGDAINCISKYVS